ncbi:hypothetical protein [Escherichia coli]
MISKLTREERVQALYDLKIGQILSLDDIENVKMLARMALAAMDSEPVAEITEDLGRLFVKIHFPTTLKAGDKLYRHAQPAPVVSSEVLNRLEHEANHITAWHHMDEHSCKVNRRDLLTLVNSCRSAMLQAVPLTNEGDIQAANSPANPGCWCRTCRPVVLNDMRFVVCPDCGNKRCPQANDHRNACTGSNEPGQEGSAYPAGPKEVK